MLKKLALAGALALAFALPSEAGAEQWLNPDHSVTSGFVLEDGAGNILGLTKLALTGIGSTVAAVKTSSGRLGFLDCDNSNSGTVYVQLFDAAAGSVTLGSTSGYPIPIQVNGGGFALGAAPLTFSSAISIAVTTTATGAAAPSSPLNCTLGYN